jgi:aminopeptidase N
MENAGNIFYAENTISGDRSQEALIAHEIAHQWFGNSASEANWHHVWLSEGFATYCTDLYFEGRYGRERLQERLREERETVFRFGPTKRMAVVDTTITDYSRLLSPNVYQKGAWVLHMLRREVGDEAFWRGLRAYYDLYRLSNALTGDFQRVMEAYSGKELTAFFQQWIFTPGHPELELDWEYDAAKKEITLQVNQLQKGGAFRFPLDVEVHGPELKRSLTLDIRQREQSFTFPLDFPAVEEVVWDPGTWLLFEQR